MKENKKDTDRMPMKTTKGDKSPATVKEPPYHDLPNDPVWPARG